jgi:hypothetical protein
MPGQQNRGKLQVGVRELLTVVSLIAVILGASRLCFPVDNLARLTAAIVVLCAACRPLYVLSRACLDHAWFENGCIESGVLFARAGPPPPFSRLSFPRFLAVLATSIFVGATLGLLLPLAGMVILFVWMMGS